MAIVTAAIRRAESSDTIDTAVRDDMAQWMRAQGCGDLALTEEHWRAVALATDVAHNLAAAAMTKLFRPGSVPPVIYLMPILPASWRLEQRRIAGLWLRHVLTRSGWPSERLALAAEIPADARATAPASVLRRLAYHGALSGMPLGGMVIAASWADRQDAPAPEADDGAAGLLLVDEAQADALRLTYNILKLGPASGQPVRFMVELAQTHVHALEGSASELCTNNEKTRRHPTDVMCDAAPVPPFLP